MTPMLRSLPPPFEKQGPQTPKDISSLNISNIQKLWPQVLTSQVAWVLCVPWESPPGLQGTWQVPWPLSARGQTARQPRPPLPPRARPQRCAHLLPGLQVPLQRLLRELPDTQLALLAGHHDANPAKAHGHFHPGPWRPRWAWPNRCLAPPVQPLLSGDAQHGQARRPGAPLFGAPSGPGARSSTPSPRGGGHRGAGIWGGGSSGKSYLPGGRGWRGWGPDAAAPRLGSSSCSCCSSGPAEAAAPRAPKRNCRPGPARP